VDGVVVHSQASVPELRALGVEAPVIYVPMPPLLPMEPSDLPPAPPYRLLFFGFVRPYKGLDVALAALALLRQRGVDATLTVAGGFWEPVERWQARVEALGLAEAVELRPRYVPDAELPALLSAHHLVVAPYRSATQSAIVPLVHAAGRPVVATSVGGLTEQVREGVNGILVPPGRSDAFADAIERALADLPALASRASESVAQWKQVVQAVETAAS
jgi:glycosyltransferase involved in cell wall biosynthesis